MLLLGNVMIAGSQASTLRIPTTPHLVPQPTPERHGLVWAQAEGVNVAKISGGLPSKRDWRKFLDHLRPSTRPLLLWIHGRVWIGSEGRSELASAIGTSSVALIVSDDIGRGLATALRWLDVKVTAYSTTQLEQLETELDLEPGATSELYETLD